MDPLYYTLLTGALGSMIASITEKKAADVVAAFEKRLQKGGQPVNHDLQRAVHEAYLKATLFVCKSFMEECGVSRELLRADDPLDRPRSEAARADAVRQKLYAEIKQLSDPDDVPSAKIPKTKLKLLLTSGNMSAKEQLETLKAELKEQVIVHISEWQDNLPYCFILMIREGWERNGVQLDWFNSLCLWFAEILKNNERVRTIFQSELLAEQAVGIEFIQERLEKLEEIGEPVREAVEHIFYIREKIDKIDGKIDGISEQNTELNRKLEELRQELIQEGRNRQTSRRKMVGTTPLERLFVDREAYLERLAEYVSDEGVSLILISGHGGFGKTALAAKFCEGIEKGGYQLCREKGLIPIRAIVYVSKSEMQYFSTDRLFDKLLQILEPEVISRLQPLIRDPKLPVALKTERLLDALQGDPVLLIFDNFEVMLKESQITHEDLKVFLQTVCSAKHSLKVIITSRYEISLEAFGDVRKNIGLKDGLETAHAVAFLRKLGAEIPQIGEAKDEQLTELSEKVYGVPMALRSLTAFLKANRRLKIADLLADDSRFEDFRKHDYKNGLRKLIQEQYDILPDEARLALQVLAVFNAPVKPLAVQYVLPNLNAEAVLDKLALDYFLAHENSDFFELHPAVQEFAYRQIPDDAARTALHTRAADFFAELKKPQSEWKSLPDLRPHLDEIEQRMKAGQYDKAAEVLLEIDGRYLLRWGHYALTTELHNSLEGKIENSDLKRRSMGSLGSAYYNMGQCKRAIDYYEQALANAHEREDQKGEGSWLNGLGFCYLALGETVRAIEYHEKSLLIARKIGYPQGEAADLGNLGNCYFALGKTACSIEFYEKALLIARKIGYPQGESAALGNLSLCYSALGETARAVEYHEQALLIDRKIRYRQGEANQLTGLGNCYSDLGETARAIEYNEKALLIDREIGYRLGETIQLGNLGDCYSALGETARSIEFYEKALLIAREIGYRQGEAIQFENLGHVFTDQSEWDKAFKSYHQAIQIADEIGFPQVQNWARWGMSLALLYSGDIPQARTVIEQAQEYNYPKNMSNVLTLLGIIALRQQDSDTAKTAFGNAVREADALLSRTPKNYEALDAKALSFCGLALCEQNPAHVSDAAAAFAAARNITRAVGIVARVRRLFDELAKSDKDGMLGDV